MQTKKKGEPLISPPLFENLRSNNYFFFFATFFFATFFFTTFFFATFFFTTFFFFFTTISHPLRLKNTIQKFSIHFSIRIKSTLLFLYCKLKRRFFSFFFIKKVRKNTARVQKKSTSYNPIVIRV